MQLKTTPIASPVYSVPPVVRAIKVLRHIASGGSVANQSRTARQLGINRTTLLRILHTLEAERLIERAPDGDDFVLGTGIIELAGRTIDGIDLAPVAQPVLAQMAADIGLSCHAGVLEGHEVVYVARAQPDARLVSNMRIGTRLPAHASSMGRAIMAFLPEETLEQLYGAFRFTAYTPQTPTSMKALRAELASTRATGVVEGRSGYEAGIVSIAAPVFNQAGGPVGAINASGPESAFGKSPEQRRHVVAAVRDAAAQISRRLGYVEAPRGAR